ncbi:thioredoxin [Candidatus Woesearchaeota archaeon]|nr:thioredoxin [Candidatus Woesearchaeota archaeon]MCF7901464.1 thioredoxin [Candidatus Woesearchaeota archaeon]MCF8013549.1 thioredoxin [Candidatus Woesearchaeota archaeon]
MEHLNAENYEKYTKEGNVIVDFWAEWCGPCQMLGPIFEELSKEITNVKFAKLNVDEAGEISGAAGVRGIPTMIMFKDGKEIDRITGFMPKESLKQKIEKTFS